MPQYVEINGEVIEFPDGMSDQEIERAIQQSMAQQPRTQSEQARGGLWNLAAGPELALAAGSGLAGTIAGGLAGTGALLQGKGPDAAAQAVRSGQEALSYQPRTQLAQGAQDLMGTISGATIEPVINWWDRQAEGVAQYTGSPALGAAVRTAPEAMAMTAGARRAGQPAKPRQAGHLHRNQVIQNLRDQSSSLYKAADKQGVIIKAQKVDAWIDHIEKRLLAKGLDDGLHPQAWAMLKRLKDRKGRDMTLQQLDIERQNMQGVTQSTIAKDAAHGSRMVRSFDDFIDNLGGKDVLAGDPKVGTQYLTAARDGWRTMRKAELIDETLEMAGVNAGTYTGAGFELALRNEFKKLLRKKVRDRRFRSTFTDTEWTMIYKVAQGGPIQNVLQWMGKFGIRNPVGGGIGAFAGYAATGEPITAVAVPLVGEAAKMSAAQIGVRRANQLFNEASKGQ